MKCAASSKQKQRESIFQSALLARERGLTFLVSHAAAIINYARHSRLVLRELGHALELIDDLLAFDNLRKTGSELLGVKNKR